MIKITNISLQCVIVTKHGTNNLNAGIHLIGMLRLEDMSTACMQERLCVVRD